MSLKDLNINLTTLNQIEEKVGSSLQDIGTGDHFLSRTPVAQTIRKSMNKWDLVKLRSFCKARDTFSKTKRLPTATDRIRGATQTVRESGRRTEDFRIRRRY